MHDRLMARRADFVAYLRKQGASEAEAEDLVQTALVRSLEPWAALPSEEVLVPWFRRVLRNALIDASRRASAAERALARYAAEPRDSGTEARRVCRCTIRVLGELKPEYAAIVEAVDVGGAAVEDAARQLGISANNASVRLHRARRALRDRLAAACGSCARGGACSDCYCGDISANPDGGSAGP